MVAWSLEGYHQRAIGDSREFEIRVDDMHVCSWRMLLIWLKAGLYINYFHGNSDLSLWERIEMHPCSFCFVLWMNPLSNGLIPQRFALCYEKYHASSRRGSACKSEGPLIEDLLVRKWNHVASLKKKFRFGLADSIFRLVDLIWFSYWWTFYRSTGKICVWT